MEKISKPYLGENDPALKALDMALLKTTGYSLGASAKESGKAGQKEERGNAYIKV